MDWSFYQYYCHTSGPIQRCLRSMVVAGYPPHPQRPHLTWSTSQSVLTIPPPPTPPPLVQLPTRQTQSTAPTPQCLVSVRSCRTTTCPHTGDQLEQRSSSTTSRPAEAEQSGQRRKGEQDQGIGVQPDSLALQPTLCPRRSPLRVVILGPSLGLLSATAAGTPRASCTGRPRPQPARAWTLLKLLLRLGAIMAHMAIENTQQATEPALPTTHSLITTSRTSPTLPLIANPSPR